MNVVDVLINLFFLWHIQNFGNQVILPFAAHSSLIGHAVADRNANI